MADINPLRYRGYYYDTDTGMYYLQSRYYDPSLKRFINADIYTDTCTGVLGTNMFAYCLNNSVMNIDADGKIALVDDVAFWAFIGLFAIVSIFAVWISTPEFRRSWNDMCTSIQYRVSKTFTTIGEFSKSLVNKISSQAKSIAQSIGDSFAKAKTIPKYKTSNELHHIVAKASKKASPARNILKKVGIDRNSSLNLVLIKTGLHRRLHSNKYYTWVNGIVTSAYNSTNGGLNKKRARVISALNMIRAYLLSISKSSPF